MIPQWLRSHLDVVVPAATDEDVLVVWVEVNAEHTHRVAHFVLPGERRLFVVAFERSH